MQCAAPAATRRLAQRSRRRSQSASCEETLFYCYNLAQPTYPTNPTYPTYPTYPTCEESYATPSPSPPPPPPQPPPLATPSPSPPPLAPLPPPGEGAGSAAADRGAAAPPRQQHFLRLVLGLQRRHLRAQP